VVDVVEHGQEAEPPVECGAAREQQQARERQPLAAGQTSIASCSSRVPLMLALAAPSGVAGASVGVAWFLSSKRSLRAPSSSAAGPRPALVGRGLGVA
jgi:hypothetical protein